jgi:hypothetical protein
VLLAMSVSFAGLPEDWPKTAISENVGLPDEIKIVPASPDIPLKISRWLGKRWEGTWDFGRDGLLFIEEVGLKKMKGIYAFGPYIGSFKAGYRPIEAKVKAGGEKIEIAFIYPNGTVETVTFQMQPDGSLKGISQARGFTHEIKMKQIGN